MRFAAGIVAVLVAALPLSAQTERLGAVEFANSCAPPLHAQLNRAVALLHDFWYEEAQRQFAAVEKPDPSCAIAHWGAAMSVFHQIWDRPGPDAMKFGQDELQSAPPAKTPRESAYLNALRVFYQPGAQEFQARIDAYSDAMGKLSREYPDDVDAAAFYALSLLASKPPGDAGLGREHAAMAVLAPLFVKYPDHPGVVHYIVHSCDNPEMAREGLGAAVRERVIAASASHSVHMPGHIFARLGMWQPDIEANLTSVAAARAAFHDHPSALFDQLHAWDFLLYAYLQSGDDAQARGVVTETAALLDHSHPAMNRTGMDITGMDMSQMIPAYRAEFPAIYALEMRDWKTAAALAPPAGAAPEIETFTWWARIVADGHLRRAEAARADRERYKALMESVKHGKHAYFAASTSALVSLHEIDGWAAFAEGDDGRALTEMRAAADLQDKVGQGEVDIPAREMLADILLELHRPDQALGEYETDLRHSPNRLNGLYNAGLAAEAAGSRDRAAQYYATLMNVAANGSHSKRPEFDHIRAFLSRP